MTIIFDLDYTLLDTKKFARLLAKALGISVKKFNADYDEYFIAKKRHYSLDKHLEILAAGRKAAVVRRIKSDIKAMWRTFGDCLFPGAEKLLVSLAAKKYRLCLATRGDKSWQRQKVDHLRIKKYFSRIIYIDGNKADALAGFARMKDVIVVNDNARETAEIRKVLPQAKFFLVPGQYAKNIKHDFSIASLKKLSKTL